MTASAAERGTPTRRASEGPHRASEGSLDTVSRLRFGLISPQPWLDRLLFVAVLGWMFLACVFPLVDTDIWWHLRTGELILERGELPYSDWFTFTDAERPWIDLHWGFQLLVALLHRVGGTDAIILFKAAVITLAVAVSWNAAGERLPAWVKAAVWLFPAIAISGRAFERPEILTQLFLATWLWIIHRLPNRPRLIWWLPPLQIVWVNCHSLFVLGLVVGACWVADRVLRTWANGRLGLAPPEQEPEPLVIQLAVLAAVVASFVNPYFEVGAVFPVEVFRKFTTDQQLYSSIGEFQQPIEFVRRYGFGNVFLLAEIGMWCVATVSFVALARQRRWSPFRLLLFAAFSHLAWKASRNTNIFSIVTAVVTLANLDELFAGWATAVPRRDAGATGSATAALSPDARKGNGRFAAAAMLLVWSAFSLAVMTGVWHRFAKENKSFGLGEQEAWFIHGAAKFAGQPGFPDRAFVANNGQAAVYLYHNGPERLVFLDGRLEVSSRETWKAYNSILAAMAAGDIRWQEMLRDSDGALPTVILDSRYSRAQLTGLLNTPGWRLVFADAAGAVFLDEKLARKLSLPPADPEPLKYPPGMRPR
jgi:hypothetical protein